MIWIIGFFALVAVSIFLFYILRRPAPHKAKERYAKLINATPVPYTIITDERKITLAPYEMMQLNITGDIYSSRNNRIESSLNLNNIDNVSYVYVTYSGLATDVNATKGVFINNTDCPVELIEYSISNNRYSLGVVGPKDSMSSIVFKIPSRWDVIKPGDDKDILATTLLQQRTSKLIFNGNKEMIRMFP
jgi:hypothetical protein